MGLFSWKCKVCGHSILSPYSLPEKLAWMNNAFAILKGENGESFVSGSYDGYGRIEGLDLFEQTGLLYEPAMFHLACWEAVGKPTRFDGPSEPADDQGFFYSDKCHEMSDEEWKQKVEEYKARIH